CVPPQGVRGGSRGRGGRAGTSIANETAWDLAPRRYRTYRRGVNYREALAIGSVHSWPCRDRHPRSSTSTNGGGPIERPDLWPGNGILDRVSGLDGHRHAGQPGCPGGPAGRVVPTV